MLLGPAKHTSDRIETKRELKSLGYQKVIIMEEYLDQENDYSLDDKFRRILKENPDYYFAMFYNGAEMDGVTFEIGWLCGMFSRLIIREKLIILSEFGYNWNSTTSYIASLFPNKVHYIPFDKTKDGFTIFDGIHAFMKSPKGRAS